MARLAELSHDALHPSLLLLSGLRAQLQPVPSLPYTTICYSTGLCVIWFIIFVYHGYVVRASKWPLYLSWPSASFQSGPGCKEVNNLLYHIVAMRLVLRYADCTHQPLECSTVEHSREPLLFLIAAYRFTTQMRLASVIALFDCLSRQLVLRFKLPHGTNHVIKSAWLHHLVTEPYHGLHIIYRKLVMIWRLVLPYTSDVVRTVIEY